MKAIITGGAGFIGCNAAANFLQNGHEIVIVDNFSRVGADSNLRWLEKKGDLVLYKKDIRNYDDVVSIFQEHSDTDFVLHFAAQVAVTTSVQAPRDDFETNALGTFNLLEAVRNTQSDPVFLYASTNKVYGKMEDLRIGLNCNCYSYKDQSNGIPESRPLDFHSPYGCSKGAADQYVRDYNRIYGLKTITFRQSCVYGYRQFGVEDQGWVAWFIIASVLDRPITIYGDGKQVRDVLFIDDLIEAFLMAYENIQATNGEVFNIGGGPANTLSLLELINMLENLLGKKIQYSFSEWRPGDQEVFVSDISKAKSKFGWFPKSNVKNGVGKLVGWVLKNRELFLK